MKPTYEEMEAKLYAAGQMLKNSAKLSAAVGDCPYAILDAVTIHLPTGKEVDLSAFNFTFRGTVSEGDSYWNSAKREWQDAECEFTAGPGVLIRFPKMIVSETVTTKGRGLNPQSIPRENVVVRAEDHEDGTLSVKELLGYPIELVEDAVKVLPHVEEIDVGKYEYRTRSRALAGQEWWDRIYGGWRAASKSHTFTFGVVRTTRHEEIPEGTFEIGKETTYTFNGRKASLEPGKYCRAGAAVFKLELPYDYA